MNRFQIGEVVEGCNFISEGAGRNGVRATIKSIIPPDVCEVEWADGETGAYLVGNLKNILPSMAADSAILAIDPGTTESGWCVFGAARVAASGVMPNDEILNLLGIVVAERLAIERVASYGMAVGREIFETCEWVGEFRNEWRRRGRGEAILIYRKDVKMHLCGTTRAKDQNVRQALLDMFPRSGGGKTPQIGTKAQPGPLFGVSSHAWAALGVAVTAVQRRPA